MTDEKVLFLCPHNAAKSILAAAYFDEFATKQSLSLSADSAGTNPDTEVMASVSDLLNQQGLQVEKKNPALVTQMQLDQASAIVSIGCDLSAWNVDAAKLHEWMDIPAPSQDLTGASELIRERVGELIEKLLP
jgi:protein-tyrosine-phosphatase